MTTRRISIARVAGVVAWTAASVSWGTAAVAVATRPSEAVASEEPLVFALPEVTTSTAALPVLPESGLMVLRYTPVEKPKPQVVTEVRVASGSGSGGGTASGSTTPAPAKKKATTTTSSGS